MKLIEGYDNHIEAERLQLDPAEKIKKCSNCDGEGEVELSIFYADSKRREYATELCPECKGSGLADVVLDTEFHKTFRKCNKCKGKGGK